MVGVVVLLLLLCLLCLLVEGLLVDDLQHTLALRQQQQTKQQRPH
jgi:hypothetical protein